MLRTLRIENLVLIREAELTFGTGLNAVTGETGAGKTIFAQAIGLLLGAKGDDSFVGPAAAEAGLLEYMGHDPVDVDSLCSRAGLSAEQVASQLLRLELDGRVASLPGGLYQRLETGERR